MTIIGWHEDVNAKELERDFDDFEYADPVNNLYPIDSEEQISAAWVHIHDNADQYHEDEVRTIKDRIKQAAKKRGIQFSSDVD